jgi:hypothetical protein
MQPCQQPMCLLSLWSDTMGRSTAQHQAVSTGPSASCVGSEQSCNPRPGPYSPGWALSCRWCRGQGQQADKPIGSSCWVFHFLSMVLFQGLRVLNHFPGSFPYPAMQATQYWPGTAYVHTCGAGLCCCHRLAVPACLAAVMHGQVCHATQSALHPPAPSMVLLACLFFTWLLDGSFILACC